MEIDRTTFLLDLDEMAALHLKFDHNYSELRRIVNLLFDKYMEESPDESIGNNTNAG